MCIDWKRSTRDSMAFCFVAATYIVLYIHRCHSYRRTFTSSYVSAEYIGKYVKDEPTYCTKRHMVSDVKHHEEAQGLSLANNLRHIVVDSVK